MISSLSLVWVAEADRVRDPVIFEIEFDRALLQSSLRPNEPGAIGAKGKMQHRAARGRAPGIFLCRKKAIAVEPAPMKAGTPPHSSACRRSAEDLAIPRDCLRKIGSSDSHVIDALEFHRAKKIVSARVAVKILASCEFPSRSPRLLRLLGGATGALFTGQCSAAARRSPRSLGFQSCTPLISMVSILPTFDYEGHPDLWRTGALRDPNRTVASGESELAPDRRRRRLPGHSSSGSATKGER